MVAAGAEEVSSRARPPPSKAEVATLRSVPDVPDGFGRFGHGHRGGIFSSKKSILSSACLKIFLAITW
jgi:hypothetical protein